MKSRICGSWYYWVCLYASKTLSFAFSSHKVKISMALFYHLLCLNFFPSCLECHRECWNVFVLKHVFMYTKYYFYELQQRHILLQAKLYSIDNISGRKTKKKFRFCTMKFIDFCFVGISDWNLIFWERKVVRKF